jgi:hypothetical protein
VFLADAVTEKQSFDFLVNHLFVVTHSAHSNSHLLSEVEGDEADDERASRIIALRKDQQRQQHIQ